MKTDQKTVSADMFPKPPLRLMLTREGQLVTVNDWDVAERIAADGWHVAELGEEIASPTSRTP